MVIWRVLRGSGKAATPTSAHWAKSDVASFQLYNGIISLDWKMNLIISSLDLSCCESAFRYQNTDFYFWSNPEKHDVETDIEICICAIKLRANKWKELLRTYFAEGSYQICNNLKITVIYTTIKFPRSGPASSGTSKDDWILYFFHLIYLKIC